MEDKHVEEIKRHFDVVAENLRDDIKLVAEGHQLLNERIKQVEQNQCEMVTKLGKIDVRTMVLEEGQKRLEQRQKGLEKGQKKLEEGQKGLEKGQKNLEKGQENMEKRQGSLERRQGNLEQGQKTLEVEMKRTRLELGGKIDRVLEKVEDHEGRIGRLEKKVAG